MSQGGYRAPSAAQTRGQTRPQGQCSEQLLPLRAPCPPVAVFPTSTHAASSPVPQRHTGTGTCLWLLCSFSVRPFPDFAGHARRPAHRWAGAHIASWIGGSRRPSVSLQDAFAVAQGHYHMLLLLRGHRVVAKDLQASVTDTTSPCRVVPAPATPRVDVRLVVEPDGRREAIFQTSCRTLFHLP